MNYTHETIKIPNKFLAWIYLHSENGIINVEKHWHRSLEMTMILSGKINYQINGRSFVAKTGDLIIINSGDIHGCSLDEPNSADAISIIFPYELLKQSCEMIENITFELNPDNTSYTYLVKLFQQLFEIYTNRNLDPFYQLRINSTVYDMLHTLFSDFQTSKTVSTFIKSQKYYERCSEIIEYIQIHFIEDITLESVANHFGISKEHFSRIFLQCMGTTFKKYLSSIRMHHAYFDLIESDYSLTQIALNNGFSDTRSFTNYFKSIYRENPQKYRKYLRESSSAHKRVFL